MRIVRAAYQNERFYAILEAERVIRLTGTPYAGIVHDGREYALEDVRLIAPAEPTKIVCVGKNYKAHADEMKEGQPEEPLLFLKPSTCIVGNEETVVYPNLSKRVDYEAELGVVIGRAAHAVQPGHAHEYIFGYTCLNDVTARDIQKGDGQWTRGKGFDTFCPTGPYIETEFSPETAEITTLLNGKIVQHSPVSAMMHGIDKLICYITQCMTLLPGDIIATGTPSGIGSMQRGDTVEVRITGLGTLRNIVR